MKLEMETIWIVLFSVLGGALIGVIITVIREYFRRKE